MINFYFEYVDIANESSDEPRCRRKVDVTRRADLLDAPFPHDRDPLRHDHSFVLIMRDENESRAELALHADQLELRLLAQLAVERGERFVEQQQLRPSRQRAGQRDALLLAAGKLVRLACAIGFELDKPQHLGDADRDLASRQAGLNEAEGNILFDTHMREQRIGLEHHIYRPQMRRHFGHVGAADQDAPLLRQLESGDEAHQSRLAAAGRAEQSEKLPRRYVERQAFDRRDHTEALGHCLQPNERFEGHQQTSALVAQRFVKPRLQHLRLDENEAAAGLFQQSLGRERRQFTRDLLAPAADARGDDVMKGRRRHDPLRSPGQCADATGAAAPHRAGA